MTDTPTRDYEQAAQDARAQVDNTRAPRLFERAVALVLDCRALGTTRKVSTGAIDTGDTDPALLRLSKQILESKTLEAIRSMQGDTRRTVASRSTPSVMFRAGVYLLSLELLADTDAYLVGQSEKLSGLVEQFLDEYDDAKATAERKLGSLYNPRDYPPRDTVRRAFSISWAYIAVDAPRKLGEVSQEIMRREQQKAAATWASALDEATAVLRAGFADLVSHMVERLAPGEDGKKRIFRDSMVGNVREFLRTFPARNLGDDAELASLAQQAAQLLDGVTPDSLRESANLREQVRTGMEVIKAKLDAAVVNAPARRYSGAEE